MPTGARKEKARLGPGRRGLQNKDRKEQEFWGTRLRQVFGERPSPYQSDWGGRGKKLPRKRGNDRKYDSRQESPKGRKGDP